MAPKATAEKKPAAEKKPRAEKKLPKDATAAGADKKKKRNKKSVETYKIYIFKVLKQEASKLARTWAWTGHTDIALKKKFKRD
ncbi:hypothetical protein L2E82_22643 [Cichorium intybus]|uniref:Uncharacterized protein n=1 Tax=Cichorium intybus TaxID=13427 RepID=A0ACB9DXT5_CICIN|nr:hypothetical protein L2E82_22643 [Cichorium intybus]